MQDPFDEMTRIGRQLHEKCGLPLMQTNKDAIERFIKADLMHLTNKSNGDEGSKCVVSDYQSKLHSAAEKRKEKEMLQKAIKVFCDLESGEAQAVGYKWPDLT